MNGKFQCSHFIPWTIPVGVAERAMLGSGRAAVIGHDVYVGPGRHVLGLVWRILGKRTIYC